MDGKQQELVKDNFELKDLCLYLDEERNNQAPSNSDPEKPAITSQESCVGDTLSCPQCGYGPIWVVSRPGETRDVNISLVKENRGSKRKEKEQKASGKHEIIDVSYHIQRIFYSIKFELF